MKGTPHPPTCHHGGSSDGLFHRRAFPTLAFGLSLPTRGREGAPLNPAGFVP
jgi:hypothetical protein